MCLGQETSSIMRYILDKTGNPAYYYKEVPENFFVPSVYFPSPEITSRGGTLSTYILSCIWFVKFFHTDTPSAYALGLSVLTALQNGRNIVPLIDSSGDISGSFMLKNPSLKRLDSSASGAAQLTLSWDSSYRYDREQAEKMANYDLHLTSVKQIPNKNKAE